MAFSQSNSHISVMRSPRSVDLDITSRCNLRCRYCYFYEDSAREYIELPTGDWRRFFHELGECGVMDVTIAGGEPFIRADLRDLLDGIIDNRMRFSILSNGGLIDDDIAAFIANTKRCSHVQISIDGSRAETHDACRGKGSFDGAIRGLKTLQRNGVPVAVRVTIHRHNVNELEDITKMLLEDLKLPRFSTNAAGYIGSCQQHSDEILLTTEQRVIAMETLLSLDERYDGRISANAGPLAEARHWQRMEDSVTRNEKSAPSTGHLTGCGCPSNKIAVRSDGVIVPCTMLAHMELGRINVDSLLDVWQNSPALNQLRRRKSIPLSDFEFCAGCQYLPHCTGNCPGLAYNLAGKVDHPSPDACFRRFLRDGGRLPTLSTSPSDKPQRGEKI